MFCKEQVEKHIIPTTTMGKTPCCEKNGLKKGPWTVEEDQKLIDYIQMHGHGRWRMLPKNAGLKRCGKSCRLRWTNYLRPDIKRGRFSIEEEETIMQLHCVLGNKWSAIAARLPGRTDNEIKNYWNTNIRKKLLRLGIDPVTHNPSLELLQLSSFLSSYHDQVLNLPSLGSIRPILNPNLRSLANAIVFSSQCKNPEFISQNLQNNQLCATLKIQENQHQSPTIQDIQGCATSSASSSPFLNGTQLMQADLESFSQAPTNFSYQNDLPNYLWQNTGETLPNYVYDYSTNQSIIDPLFENQQIFQSNNNDIENIHDSGFGSVLSSTTSSSQTHLNSSSITYANGNTTEDERDSYCSNMLMFGMPNNLQVDGFL